MTNLADERRRRERRTYLDRLAASAPPMNSDTHARIANMLGLSPAAQHQQATAA